MAQPKRTTFRRRTLAILRRVGRTALDAGLVLTWCWALLALWFFNHVPGWFAAGMAFAWILGSGGILFCARAAARRFLAAGILAVVLFWSLQDPSNQRDWSPNQERMATAKFTDDGSVVIQNFRNSTYAPDGRRDPVRTEWRIVFPGYSDQLAHELGLIDFEGSIEEAREKFLIGNSEGPVWPRTRRSEPGSSGAE